MNWNAYVNAPTLRPSAQIDLTASGLTDNDPEPALYVGDKLFVEFPDNTRSGGSVIEASEQEALIEVGGRQWRLKLAGKRDRRSSWLVIDAA
jgi:hypothetical protein